MINKSILNWNWTEIITTAQSNTKVINIDLDKSISLPNKDNIRYQQNLAHIVFKAEFIQ
jgi:hypothetical protein